MQDKPRALFHLDQPAAGSTVPAGRVILKGWALEAGGRPLVDLRVRLAGKLHPGVLGFLRADLAAHFKAREPHVPSGFEVYVHLPAGTHELVFEACDITGHWDQLGSVTLTGQAPGELRAPEPVVSLRPMDFSRALVAVLRRADGESLEQAAQALVSELPSPPTIRFPDLPFHGHLDQPALLERTLFGRLWVYGWLFHESLAIRRLVATADLQGWNSLQHGIEIASVAAMFPQFPHAKSCGFTGLVDIPAQLPSPLTLRIYAQLADGTWHLGQVQRVRVTDHEREKAPLIRYNPVTFVCAVLALRHAALARGFSVPAGRAWWTGLREAHGEYRRLAARHRATATPEDTRPLDPAAPPPATVTLVTHNLNREGAPLFLLELARYLVTRGSKLNVVSASEGPLHADYQQLGAAVQFVDLRPLLAARNGGELESALTHLGTPADLRDTNLVIANTLSAFWGVHLAHRAGRPSLFYIHESTTPAAFYYGHLPPATLPPIERTFALATEVSFLTESTRRYYRPLITRPNHRLNPGWIDLGRLDAQLAARPRAALRAALGVAPATRLVVNIGNICDRKAQHIFARAVDLLWRRAPELAASARFLMVGGRDTLYDRDIADLLAHLDRANLVAIPETGTPLDYYGAADLFVCSSYEESFPRVVLEAMAVRLPIVATNVHGIPEMTRDGMEARLVPPGDTHALCEAMIALLSDPALGKKYAEAARARVAANYDSALLLPRHAAMAAMTAADELK